MNLFFIFIAQALALKPICKNCKHFIGDTMECKKFSDVNLVTGEISYQSARWARSDEKKCGESAIHFEENNYKIITVPYYFIKKYGFAIPYFVMLIIYILVSLR
jgi:hypothetical protein